MAPSDGRARSLRHVQEEVSDERAALLGGTEVITVLRLCRAAFVHVPCTFRDFYWYHHACSILVLVPVTIGYIYALLQHITLSTCHL